MNGQIKRTAWRFSLFEGKRKMIYGFIKEDFEHLDERNPLWIQAQYAKYIDQYCEVDLKNGKIKDEYGQNRSVYHQVVLLRASCDNAGRGMKVLAKEGAILVECEKDVKQIESWYELGITQRKIREITYQDILDEKIEINRSDSYMFIKSKIKGFSCCVRSERLWEKEKDFMVFLESQCKQWGECLLLCRAIKLKSDSLGKRETRHVVINNKVINSSRHTIALVHTVSERYKIYAQKIADLICKKGNFPNSYVLDIGEFVEKDKNYLDVVEINPLTTAMCYINNSIFMENTEMDKKDTGKFGMGVEYIMDYKQSPKKYVLQRTSNGNYEYASDSYYEFL